MSVVAAVQFSRDRCGEVGMVNRILELRTNYIVPKPGCREGRATRALVNDITAIEA